MSMSSPSRFAPGSLLWALYRFVRKKEAQLMLRLDGLCVQLACGLRFNLEAMKGRDMSPILPELSCWYEVT